MMKYPNISIFVHEETLNAVNVVMLDLINPVKKNH